ncbi:MAG: ferrous iron transporter B [Deltaproteobacteria bacterium CG11_big_fil_rev_8_21_14_0_20_49_13]|nr:MAG: ferrous iron transporter B [Deltaproteobacteria bacterium CG11_big_fil_rev_8_21_14_0_20_49_13]
MTAETKKIVLVGQPNVGKSVVFGCLTGRYATVSNYPGTTVEVSRGNAKTGDHTCEIVDTPGLYSIFPITEEERVSLRVIENEYPDLIVHVIDAKNLERMLPLTFQLKLTGIPVVVAINMFDEALAMGMTIDTSLLSDRLECPVIATVAITNQGINQLIHTISEYTKHKAQTANHEWPPFSEHLMKEWYKRSLDICGLVIKKREKPRGLSRIDKIIISPFTGSVILALILYLGLYKFVGVFGAGVVVNFLEGIFLDHINPWLLNMAESYVPWPAVQQLLVGEYGILTLGIRYATAIILPIVGLFFFVFAIIEDSGYLPRLSFLLDRVFKKIGLSGKAVIPMVLGLGCDTMATMVTRTLPTRRERLIAILLLSLCIPCSAQIGVILGLLGGTPYVLVTWFVIIVLIFGFVGALLSWLVPGAKPSFIVEIPPMRVPQIANVLAKTFARMKWYFKEIVPLFVLASFLIWLGQLTGIFDKLVKAVSYPLLMMGLPASASPAFIFGFFRRDYGAAGLYDLHKQGVFTNNQLLIAVVVLTLFLPCITQFLITIKERGLKAGFGISLFVLLFAFLTGILLNFTLINAGINF